MSLRFVYVVDGLDVTGYRSEVASETSGDKVPFERAFTLISRYR